MVIATKHYTRHHFFPCVPILQCVGIIKALRAFEKVAQHIPRCAIVIPRVKVEYHGLAVNIHTVGKIPLFPVYFKRSGAAVQIVECVKPFKIMIFNIFRRDKSGGLAVIVKTRQIFGFIYVDIFACCGLRFRIRLVPLAHLVMVIKPAVVVIHHSVAVVVVVGHRERLDLRDNAECLRRYGLFTVSVLRVSVFHVVGVFFLPLLRKDIERPGHECDRKGLTTRGAFGRYRPFARA